MVKHITVRIKHHSLKRNCFAGLEVVRVNGQAAAVGKIRYTYLGQVGRAAVLVVVNRQLVQLCILIHDYELNIEMGEIVIVP